MPRLLHAALLIPALLAAACGDRARNQYSDAPLERSGGTAPAGVAAPKEGYAVSPGRDEVAQSAPDATTAQPTPAEPPSTGPEMPTSTDTQSVAPQMIIRTGSATVRVDSLEAAMARVEQLARSLGGYVANTAIQSGSETLRRASMELKIPAARWNQAISGLRPIGELESQQTNTEDVGEEYVDVTARMTNARRLETRLVELLATRTGRLEDVLAVERELARVREEIERYEGRLRYLRTRAAVSTLTVELHEPSPVLAPGQSPILDAFRDAWRNFVGFTAGFIASLGWLIPLLLVIAGLVWILRRLFRGRSPFGRWQRGSAPGAPRQGPPSQPPV
jgi:hypothetical protein